MTMSDKTKGKRWGWTAAVCVLLTLLVLYPLSIGPGSQIAFAYGRADLLETVYAPVLWAASESETVNEFVGWYLQLWARMLRPA